MRLRIPILTLVVLALLAGTAIAATIITLHHTKKFSVAAGKTKSFAVAYPDALKYSGTTYSGSVKLLLPSSSNKPSLSKVHVLSKDSCMGGSEYCVKVKNSNAGGTAAVRVKVTATSKVPLPGSY